MSDVTKILSQIESGDPSAAEQLLPLVYDELCKHGGQIWFICFLGVTSAVLALPQPKKQKNQI